MNSLHSTKRLIYSKVTYENVQRKIFFTIKNIENKQTSMYEINHILIN